MKMYKENFGFNNFNKKKLLAMFSVYIFIFVVFISVGFSAFQEELLLEDISARVNFQTNVRVTGFEVATSSNNAIASNTDYNYDRIYGDIILSESTSSVTYQMKITNIGKIKIGISSITGLSENLKYTLLDYNIGESISQDGEYTLGVTQTILIKIEYADNATITSENQSFNLEIAFKPFHSVTYHGVPGQENFPTEIMDGTDLVITSDMTSMDRLKITQDTVFLTYGEDYLYDDATNQLTVKNVTGDLLLSYRDITYLASLVSNEAYFKEATYKDYITRIDFVDYIDTSNALEEPIYDLSADQDESIIGWLETIDNDNDGVADTATNGNYLYRLYIGSIYDIYSKNMENAFAYMYGLETITFDNLDTSESTSFNYTFFKTSISYLDLSTFNTTSATSMLDMFGDMTQLKTLDVSNFNTSKVTNMYYMFGGLSGLTELDISTFDTSKVRNMSYMFSGMSSLKTLNLGKNFNTARVTNMAYMFNGLYALTSLDTSTFDTTSLTNADHMFYNCRVLKALDLSTFKMANVTNMSYMFGNMYGLETLIIDNFNTSSAINMSGMFTYCQKLTSLDLSHFDTSKVITMYQMFGYMYALESIDLSNFTIGESLDDTSKMFTKCTSLKQVDLRSADFADNNITTYSTMFESVPSEITVIVKDDIAQAWIQDKLGEGVGTVTKVTDIEGETTEGETTT